MTAQAINHKMLQNPLFNPNGNDEVEVRTIIKGSTTGLFNLNDVKYPWAKSLYQVMIGNFWIPEKVSGLKDDARMFHADLTPEEQRAYKGILSFLIFLDSIQTVNLPHFSDFITSPEVNLILSIQAYQEAIHSQSYATILESIVESKERKEIYYFFRSDAILLERNKYIGGIYQDFIDTPSDHNFFRGVVANFLLEGLYFSKPLVSTELGTGTSIVNRHNHTGFVVQAGCHLCLARAIDKILTDEHCAQGFSKNAFHHYLDNFTARAQGDKYLRIYRSLL